MTQKTRNFAILLVVFLCASGVAWYVGGGKKEVVIESPSEAERAAQMQNMTPEQRQAAEAVLEAIRTQAQEQVSQQAK